MTTSVPVRRGRSAILGSVDIDKCPYPRKPLLKWDVESRFAWSEAYHRPRRDAVFSIDPPTDANRSRVLELDVRVSHPLKSRFWRRSPARALSRSVRRVASHALMIACLASPSSARVASAETSLVQPTRALWRSIIGDVIVEFRRSETPGALSIALADSVSAVSMSVRATDATRIADSLLRVVGRRRLPAPGFRLSLEEPGLGSGALRFGRREVPKGERPAQPFSLFASDDALTGVSVPISVAELKVFATRLRSAARAVTPPSQQKRKGSK